MFAAMHPVFLEAVRHGKAVHTESTKRHCRALARAITREVKRAKNPAEKFRICKRIDRAIREINHAYTRKCGY